MPTGGKQAIQPSLDLGRSFAPRLSRPLPRGNRNRGRRMAEWRLCNSKGLRDFG